ncbi:hypothetical protein [Spiroplasma endosymbiont of Dilophus febrilis]|uniref:hypothetical protein n=1 Tax=Spiroplasma endosymbiont of Dilophus febrilis TaxID=3066292 RepID=UPI00313DDCEB
MSLVKIIVKSLYILLIKKTGLEQKIWASKSAVESVRTDLVGDNWLCVDFVEHNYLKK